MGASSALKSDSTTSSIGVIDIAYAAFLFLVLVGLEPFKIRNAFDLQQISSGEGDIARQVAYLSVFSVILAVALQRRGAAILAAVPVPIYVALVWCVLSILWSVAPDVSLRRIALTSLVVLTTFFSVDLIGAERALRLLRLVLAAILLLNLSSLFFVPQAIHLSGEAGTALVGNWRGLHFHKNLAGPIASMSALVFLHFAVNRKQVKDWVLFFLAVIFTVGTSSKTAISLLICVVVAATVYRYCQNSARRMSVLRIATYFALAYVLLVSFIFQDYIMQLLSDPDALTGRGAIWQLSITYLAEHPVLGSGFGAFWQSGSYSPVLDLARERWLITAAHSHNGYIEVAVTTGVTGLVIAAFAFVVFPFRQLLRSHGPHHVLIWSFVIFFILLNVTETRLLDRDRPEWVLFLVALAVLHEARRPPANRPAVA